jgi:aryl-alcohol dehydrogenase-like predicted oxidoreductase
MQRTTIPGTDISVSRLSLGTWAFGSDPVWGEQDDKVSIDTVSAALEAGIDFIDSAAGYADGRSEEVLGRALKGRRERAVVATKVYGTLSRDGIVSACEASLKRLGTDYVDVFYIHWPMPDLVLDDALAGLRDLKESGKIRAAGISNFGPRWLDELGEARDNGIIVLHQLPYSLFWRAIEFDILPRSRAMGHMVVAYSTLAQGLLTGRYKSAADVPASLHVTRWYGDGPHGEAGAEAEVFQALTELERIAREVAVKVPDLAIQWVLTQPGVGVALTGARTPTEIIDNAQALDREIDATVFQRMSAIAEPVRLKLGPNPDMWKNAAETRYR